MQSCELVLCAEWSIALQRARSSLASQCRVHDAQSKHAECCCLSFRMPPLPPRSDDEIDGRASAVLTAMRWLTRSAGRSARGGADTLSECSSHVVIRWLRLLSVSVVSIRWLNRWLMSLSLLLLLWEGLVRLGRVEGRRQQAKGRGKNKTNKSNGPFIRAHAAHHHRTSHSHARADTRHYCIDDHQANCRRACTDVVRIRFVRSFAHPTGRRHVPAHVSQAESVHAVRAHTTHDSYLSMGG